MNPLAIAQAAPKYDATSEIKMTGTVEDLKLPPKGHEKEIVHLVMKNGDQTVDIYLCPKFFIDEIGVAFNKGDEIAFTGSKISQNGVEMMLAREIVKGQDTVVLRDGKGKPVW
jgi:nitric oxide synthase oxygenase domain/subunit